MAERRMFAKSIILADEFLDMPATARSLYITLCMMADDDGFVNSPKSIMRMAGATGNDLETLITLRFVIKFDTGVIVIRHWKIHNRIQSDRYKKTNHVAEMSTLTLTENKTYIETESIADSTSTPCVSNLDTQDRSVEVNVGEVNTGEIRVIANNHSRGFTPPSVDEVYAYCQERQNRIDAQRFIDYYTMNGWRVGSRTMADWKAAVRMWEHNERQNKSNPFLDLVGDGHG